MKGNILIVDSGMRNRGGHNFSYTQAVSAVLEQKGFGVTVYANKNLDRGVADVSGYHTVFSLGAYDFAPGHGLWKDMKYIYAQSVTFCRQLELAMERDAAKKFSLVFCHTVADFELISWNRYLSHQSFPGRLVILLRQTPNFNSCGRLKRWIHPYWRIKPHYLNGIHAKLGERFTACTDSRALTADHAIIYRHKIVTLPIPINDYVLNPPDEKPLPPDAVSGRYDMSRGDELRVGYMGDARGAKGFALLPHLIQRLLDVPGLKARFIIQCPNSAGGIESERHEDGVAELIQLAQRAGRRVVLVQERLSDADYADMLRHLDIVLLPYQHPIYKCATSGIFAEAVALAKPVVIPHGTWMADELKNHGAGAGFRPGDIDDMTEKTLTLIRDYERYAKRAKDAGAKWRDFHNSRRLVDMLLRESGLDSGASLSAAGR